jgi:hypothetical protein
MYTLQYRWTWDHVCHRRPFSLSPPTPIAIPSQRNSKPPNEAISIIPRDRNQKYNKKLTFGVGGLLGLSVVGNCVGTGSAVGASVLCEEMIGAGGQ